MKTIKIILLAMLISFVLNTMAQVAINNDGSSPDASAMLEVKSTDKGFLTPRMTLSEIESISNPANGLIVFNNTDNKFYAFISIDNEWKEILYGTGTITPPWICGNVLVDTRDSQPYTTVQIGTQCWMAENLNIGTRIDGGDQQTDNSIIEKFCYNDNTSNCDIYGGLYLWAEMMQYNTTEGVQGICPNGWHLPADEEWTTLTNYLGGASVAGEKMKSTSGWNNNGNGTNSSGFNALPGGLRHSSRYFDLLGDYSFSWSSTEHIGTNAWYRKLYYNYDAVIRESSIKWFSYSVRCLKD
ncbi:MAG: FISUMP domain-containing protein [Bacteroidota bacterium]